MAQRSLDPIPASPMPEPSVPASDEAAGAGRLSATEHDRAAMLAEFNGTYDLAQQHREAAARLRHERSGTNTA
jgi:hypothetical protein